MNRYETVIIIKGELSKLKNSETIEKVKNKIKEFGEIVEQQDMGIRKMAYTINNQSNGHYLVFRYKIEETQSKNAIHEIERFFRIND